MRVLITIKLIFNMYIFFNILDIFYLQIITWHYNIEKINYLQGGVGVDLSVFI